MRQRQRRRPPKIASSSNHWKNIIAFWMLTMTEAIDVLFHITTTPRVRLLGTSVMAVVSRVYLVVARGRRR
ncbi:hypothetical protein GN244_ATG08057 [Phytophthora infestans]|uniref:Uncharacterized protein n=1 Tax=Phytophthora infestans TaxID=4787 RepID=A0A833WF87_PHYIN|nr:hypothetical protein GN244_ATG08057 [Phytophthora infestans]KAF4129748.1 hypothetical protein GN958_ATG21051 [Phytophthora infestans]